MSAPPETPRPGRVPAAREQDVPARTGEPEMSPPLSDPRNAGPDFAEFQPDALEIEARPAPVAARLTLYAILAFLLTALAWSCLAKLDRVVAAPGKIAASGKNIVIQPMETSIIKDILVSEGQSVAKGQPLVRLDPDFSGGGFEEQEKRRQSLLAQIWRLECETSGRCPPLAAAPKEELDLQEKILDERRQEYASRLESLDKKIEELEARLHTNEAASGQARKQIEIAKTLEDMYKDVFEKGASSKLELMRAKSGRIEAETLLKKLTNEAEEIRQSLDGARADRESFIRNWNQEAATELVGARRELDQTEERGRRSSRLRELAELDAPAPGVVLELAQRAVGSVVDQGEPIMTLTPLDVPLEAEVNVDARDIGFLRVGDPARIKLDAFPFQRHGVLEGAIRTISPDAFETETPEGKGLAYRVRIAITKNGLTAVPPDFKLLPGMALTGEIKVGERRAITYLLYPVIRVFDETMREP